MTPESIAFLANAAAAAVRSQDATGVPAELTLAQAIFESGWGAHTPGNNCFGIKANGRGSGTQIVATKEFIHGAWCEVNLSFEKYATLADCFTDHARLISTGAPYAAAWKAYKDGGTLGGLVLDIGPIYATAPGYGQTILSFAKSPTIRQALERVPA